MADTLLLLDVDGVISPWMRPTASHGGWTGWRSNPELVPWDWFWWSPDQVAAVADLDVDVVWLTAWQDRANAHLPSLFGWEVRPYPVIRWMTGPNDDHAHKALGLGRWLDEQWSDGGWDRALWVDDELADGGALDFSRPLVNNPLEARAVDHLVLGPDRNVGLTVDDLDTIRRWVERAETHGDG